MCTEPARPADRIGDTLEWNTWVLFHHKEARAKYWPNATDDEFHSALKETAAIVDQQMRRIPTENLFPMGDRYVAPGIPLDLQAMSKER